LPHKKKMVRAEKIEFTKNVSREKKRGGDLSDTAEGLLGYSGKNELSLGSILKRGKKRLKTERQKTFQSA